MDEQKNGDLQMRGIQIQSGYFSSGVLLSDPATPDDNKSTSLHSSSELMKHQISK